jgi:transposase
VTEFRRVVRTHDAQGLTDWLAAAETSALREFRDFAAGLRRDYAAVEAAVTSAWSSGQVEGQVTRLKLVKRSMYGRAEFPLLRQRFLLAGSR